MESKRTTQPAEYSPLFDPVLKAFNDFWDLPLDAIMQEILDGGNPRLALRIANGLFEKASVQDRTALTGWLKKLEEQKKKSGAEWALLGLIYQCLPNTFSNWRLYFEEAVKQNNPIGLVEFAEYFTDKNKPEEAALCLEYRERAAKQGSAAAYAVLGQQPIPGNREEILKERTRRMTLAAEGNSLEALEWFYDYYRMAEKDSVTAKKYRERQIALGSLTAIRQLAFDLVDHTEDKLRGWFYFRHAGERDCLSAVSLWNYFVKTETPDPALIYHLRLLLQHADAKKAVEYEFKIRIANERNTLPDLYSFFEKLVREDFTSFNYLSNQEPWEKVKGVFSNPEEAQQLYARKIEDAAQVLIALLKKGLSLHNALALFQMTNPIHPSYLPDIKKAVCSYQESETHLREKTLLGLVETRLKFLKAEIEKQLTPYLGNDPKKAEDYRKQSLTRVFDAEEKTLEDPRDRLIKADKALMQTYQELRETAAFYGPLKQRDSFKILNAVDKLLQQMENTPSNGSSPTFFPPTNQRRDFITKARQLVTPRFFGRDPSLRSG